MQLLDVGFLEAEIGRGGRDLDVCEHANLQPARDQTPDLLKLLKILREERLRDRQRARYLGVEHLLAGAIAQDLAAAPDDLRATLLAAATTAALVSVGESLQPGSAEAIPYEDALSILEQMFSVLHAGLTKPQSARKPTHRRRSGSQNPR